ncbi:MAG: XTP/dITP diphosphatase [Dehalococcoidia bacterium]|nr:XTP/dITP diphosphatase [Dehalococcoidia bacterium]
MEKLLIATGNPGKLREFTQLLGDIPYRLVSLRDQGIDIEVEETGGTFEANARLKAEAYARVSGLLTLADDSGLAVDALGGAPGVLSARYGGPNLTDAERVVLLLRNLEGVLDAQRTARFVCVIALATPQATIHTLRGEVEGLITREPRGTNGFGYDPVFLAPSLGLTTAELPPEQKNALSHRGRAARAMRDYLAGLAHGD